MESETEEEEDDEATLVAKLRAVGVREGRAPPQYYPLSKHQRLQYTDAMNVRVHP